MLAAPHRADYARQHCQARGCSPVPCSRSACYGISPARQAQASAPEYRSQKSHGLPPGDRTQDMPEAEARSDGLAGASARSDWTGVARKGRNDRHEAAATQTGLEPLPFPKSDEGARSGPGQARRNAAGVPAADIAYLWTLFPQHSESVARHQGSQQRAQIPKSERSERVPALESPANDPTGPGAPPGPRLQHNGSSGTTDALFLLRRSCLIATHAYAPDAP